MIFGDWVRTIWHGATNLAVTLNPFNTTVRHPVPRAIIGEGPASRTRSIVDLSKEPAAADVEIADQPHHKQQSTGWFASTFHTSSSSQKTHTKAQNDDSESSAWPKLLTPGNLFHHAHSSSTPKPSGSQTPAQSKKSESAKKNESPVAISGRRPVSAGRSASERSPRGGSRPASRRASANKSSAKRARSVSKPRARPRTASPTKEPVEKKAKKTSVAGKKSTEKGQKRKAEASGGSGGKRNLRSRASKDFVSPSEGGQKRKAGASTGSGKQSRAK